jgi:hypothetical protein
MTYFFKARISKVEERFEKIYKPETVAEAKVESQMETEQKSIGWFVSLDGWGIAIKVSDSKPELVAGDEVIMGMRKAP